MSCYFGHGTMSENASLALQMVMIPIWQTKHQYQHRMWFGQVNKLQHPFFTVNYINLSFS